MTNTPEEILEVLGKRFAKEHHPQKLDVWFPCGVGNYQGQGLEHLAQKCMLNRVVGSHWESMPKLQKMVNNNDIEAYCLPQGAIRKFVKNVQQITFSGNYANETDQEVYFVTERATFKLTDKGLKLLSYVSGIDLKRDVLDQMDFMPIIAKDVKRYKLKGEE